MINIVTSKTKLEEEYLYQFYDCEEFFKAKIHSKDFNEDDLEAMRIIDGAILIDKNMGTIKTDFGVTVIDNLSTGCKVVLTYLYIQRHRDDYDNKVLLDVTECGANALDVLFDLMEKYGDLDIVLLLEHSNYLFKCKKHNYLVDGKRKTELF